MAPVWHKSKVVRIGAGLRVPLSQCSAIEAYYIGGFDPPPNNAGRKMYA